MTLPQLEQFPSRPTPDGRGRVYDVWKRVHLLAYFIDDSESLRPAGADDGFYLYAFVEGRKVGAWNWTAEFKKIELAMHTFRTASDPDAERPVPRAPGGEPAMIFPPFNVNVEDVLEQRGDDITPD